MDGQTDMTYYDVPKVNLTGSTDCAGSPTHG